MTIELVLLHNGSACDLPAWGDACPERGIQGKRLGPTDSPPTAGSTLPPRALADGRAVSRHHPLETSRRPA